MDVFSKTGRDLLPEETVEYFSGFSSAPHQHIICEKLSEYTMAEWVFCLYEKVLLEQCVPQFFDVLDKNPLSPGIYYKGEILYHITLIDKAFWSAHEDWLEFFKKITHRALDMAVKELADSNITNIYIESYRNFVGSDNKES